MSSVKKIAILNPYLLNNITESAEIESAKRFCLGAQKYGIEARVFDKSSAIAKFNPDFAITITYQEPKLTHYPTYGLLTMPTSWVKDSQRFVRNILSYDGYLTTASSVKYWLKLITAKYAKRLHIAHAAFAIGKTEYKLCDFASGKGVYLGTNWDKNRHQRLFNYLSNGEYIKCFGPRSSWNHYPETLFGGEIPFDGISPIKIYQKNAIGLCINHSDFDQEGIPTSRTFEIAAASALPICSLNKQTQEVFGDSVLYINQNRDTQEFANQIIEAVNWVRSNPSIAAEMAHSCHEKFNEQLSLECFIPNILEMHEDVMRSNGYATKVQATSRVTYHKTPEKVAYLFVVEEIDDSFHETINSLTSQSYEDILIYFICDDYIKHQLETIVDFNRHTCINLTQDNIIETLHLSLIKAGVQWFSLVKPGTVFSPNHIELQLKTYHNLAQSIKNQIRSISSGTLLYSDSDTLQDDIQDGYMLYSVNDSKIEYLPHSNQVKHNCIPLSSCLFKAAALGMDLKYHFDLRDLPEKIEKQSVGQSFNWLDIPHITCANKHISKHIHLEKDTQ